MELGATEELDPLGKATSECEGQGRAITGLAIEPYQALYVLCICIMCHNRCVHLAQS